MPAFITFGRILFAVLFIFSGASKLLDLTATAQMTEKIVIPAALATYTSQLEGLNGHVDAANARDCGRRG